MIGAEFIINRILIHSCKVPVAQLCSRENLAIYQEEKLQDFLMPFWMEFISLEVKIKKESYKQS